MAQVFLALAEQVPDKDGKLVANPYKNWSDIDTSLPNVKIEVLGPPPTSGTRDSFHELFMEEGRRDDSRAQGHCKKADAKAFEKRLEVDPQGRRLRRGRRERQRDRAEARGQQECLRHLRLLVPRGERRQAAEASPIDGVEPTYDTIAGGKYKGARPLFVYVKKQHIGVVPGIDKFVAEYVSDKAMVEGRLSGAQGPRRSAEGRGRQGRARLPRPCRRSPAADVT